MDLQTAAVPAAPIQEGVQQRRRQGIFLAANAPTSSCCDRILIIKWLLGVCLLGIRAKPLQPVVTDTFCVEPREKQPLLSFLWQGVPVLPQTLSVGTVLCSCAFASPHLVHGVL
eukprot:442075-Heterocapsa_arctica.AAC.1